VLRVPCLPVYVSTFSRVPLVIDEG